MATDNVNNMFFAASAAGMPRIKTPIKEGLKSFYDAMFSLAVAAADAGAGKGTEVQIGGTNYDFSNTLELAGTIAKADFNVQAYSQAIQFILKVDVTYINDLFKEAGRMVG
ncbi:MAG: hypothetical protein AABZ57_08700 [Candidatus Margulisiibacteriota bacterium]